MDALFRFKRFSVRNTDSALKVGTDAVLLGTVMSIPGHCSRALDIGTGTGVIALIAAQRTEDFREPCHITGIDIDSASAQEAASNFALSPWSDRLQAQCVPLQEFSPGTEFDHIFSNPPYYDRSLRSSELRVSRARHSDTLDFDSLLSHSRSLLAPQGILSLIIPCEIVSDLRRRASSYGLYPFRLVKIRTTDRKFPKRAVVEFSTERVELDTEELTMTRDGVWTPEYSHYVDDFYLKKT